MRSKVESVLRRFFEREANRGISSVYLFGSVAEGRAHAESDVDLGVLLDWKVFSDPKGRFDLRLLLSSRLMSELKQAVDLVILNDAPPHLARHISRGKRIFCSDGAADHAFVRDARLKAADLEPFLRRMRQIKLEALAPS